MAHRRNRTANDIAIGKRLRAVRNAKGLSLGDVEKLSGGRWKAVVIGSYERADRTMTPGKLCELADWYGEPVMSLLPAPAPRKDGVPDFGPDVDFTARDGRWILTIGGPDTLATASSPDRAVLEAMAGAYVSVRPAEGPGKAA